VARIVYALVGAWTLVNRGLIGRLMGAGWTMRREDFGGSLEIGKVSPFVQQKGLSLVLGSAAYYPEGDAGPLLVLVAVLGGRVGHLKARGSAWLVMRRGKEDQVFSSSHTHDEGAILGIEKRGRRIGSDYQDCGRRLATKMCSIIYTRTHLWGVGKCDALDENSCEWCSGRRLGLGNNLTSLVEEPLAPPIGGSVLNMRSPNGGRWGSCRLELPSWICDPLLIDCRYALQWIVFLVVLSPVIHRREEGSRKEFQIITYTLHTNRANFLFPVMKKARALEFYSGIGGLHRALQRSGVAGDVVAAFDWDQTACRVYAANHGPGIVRKTDISTLTTSELAAMDADLWLLSPSCQPYTVLNPAAKGAADPRAKSFLYLIENVLPSLVPVGGHPNYLLIENVAGFEVLRSRCDIFFEVA
jgi:hypothetical protein